MGMAGHQARSVRPLLPPRAWSSSSRRKPPADQRATDQNHGASPHGGNASGFNECALVIEDQNRLAPDHHLTVGHDQFAEPGGEEFGRLVVTHGLANVRFGRAAVDRIR
jgi:hypothetical protein